MEISEEATAPVVKKVVKEQQHRVTVDGLRVSSYEITRLEK